MCKWPLANLANDYLLSLGPVCACGQLGAHLCANECGIVHVVNIVHVCVERGHGTLAMLGGEKAIVRV